jgi:hypothetical protein
MKSTYRRNAPLIGHKNSYDQHGRSHSSLADYGKDNSPSPLGNAAGKCDPQIPHAAFDKIDARRATEANAGDKISKRAQTRVVD